MDKNCRYCDALVTLPALIRRAPDAKPYMHRECFEQRFSDLHAAAHNEHNSPFVRRKAKEKRDQFAAEYRFVEAW